MRRPATTLLLFGVLLGGCGGSGETKTVTEAAASTTPTTATEAPPQTDTGGDTTGTTATPPSGEGPVLASRVGTVGHDPIKLEIVELKRSGATTALTLRLTKTGDDGGSTQVAGTFDDGIFQKSTQKDAGSGVGGDSLDGVFLVDAKNRKKYLVGRDADNLCACDGDLASTFVQPGAPVNLSATFAAPPADVTAVDVFIPSFGTFKDVPLG